MRYGKIIDCMNSENYQVIQKPKIIQAFVNGFNTTANHIYLLLFPILIDLFLWFGPHFGLKTVITNSLRSFTDLYSFPDPASQSFLENFNVTVRQFAERFNLSSLIRTIPVGIPSLIARLFPISNPIGLPIRFELDSLGSIGLVGIIFLLFGLVLGSLFFQQTARSVLTDLKKGTFKDFYRSVLQVLLFPVIALLFILILSIPLSLIISLLSLLSPMLGQVGLLFFMVILTWIIIPLFFTPHSVFLYKQSLIPSMLTSISIVRYSLPGSALFLMAVVILSEGMNILWQSPPEDSWMLLVGIVGHAFISTATLNATYHYFLDATKYTQTLMQKLTKKEIIS